MSRRDADYDAVLRELQPGYIARRRAELAVLHDALAAHEFDRLRVVGHNLRGSGGAYGLPGISQLGAALETAAGSSDGDAVRDVLQRLRNLLATLDS